MRRRGAWALRLGVGLVAAFGISLVTVVGLGDSAGRLPGATTNSNRRVSTPRGDALFVMWASSEIVGTVRYCEKYVSGAVRAAKEAHEEFLRYE